MRAAILVLVLALPTIARAQTSNVTVMLSPQGQTLAAQAGISQMDLESRIKDQVDNAYDLAHVDKFLRSFGDATSFAQRGLGVDYMSVPGSFMLGLGAQVGVSSTDELTLDQRPTNGGAALNASLMIGYNLKDAGHPRWTLFANGFYENGSTDSLKGNILTGGFHIQVKLVEPQDDGGAAIVVRWGGIDLTTGVEFTRWSFGANDTITQTFNVDGINQQLQLDSQGRFDLTSTAGTVPIELTTGLRILELVSVYVGAGFDVTGGKSTIDADLTGTVTTPDKTNVGTVHITESGNNTSSPGTFRGLAGVQLNLWKLKLYSQVNVSQLPAASVGFGVRLVL